MISELYQVRTLPVDGQNKMLQAELTSQSRSNQNYY